MKILPKPVTVMKLYRFLRVLKYGQFHFIVFSEVVEKFPVLLADYFSRQPVWMRSCIDTLEKAFDSKYQTESAE